MSELRPPAADTQIIPVMTRPDPRFERGHWNEDRTGRFVIVGLVMSLAFLLVAAAIWWASGGATGRSAALAASASTIAPPTEPAPIADVATSLPTLPLSSEPLPPQGLAKTDVATPAQVAPATSLAASPPTTEAVAPATSIDTTTTTVAPTTTSPPTTTTPATTVAATVAPTTTSPPTTTSTIAATTTTTSPPSTTVPGPVVTSPAAADATLLDVVEDTPDLSRVRELVDSSGFAPELEAARALTFLAPGNDAIDAWAATPEGQATLADPDAVYDLLLRHLVPEALDEATIFTRSSLVTVSDAQLVVRQQSRTIDGADLLVADVTAANGYLHVVSDVLTGA